MRRYASVVIAISFQKLPRHFPSKGQFVMPEAYLARLAAHMKQCRHRWETPAQR
jgi:hypothetical protein